MQPTSVIGRGATRRRHMEASRRLLSSSPRRSSASPPRLPDTKDSPVPPGSPGPSLPPPPQPETETSFTEVPRPSRNPGDLNGNPFFPRPPPLDQESPVERRTSKKKGAVEII